jgi:hypothetical protein
MPQTPKSATDHQIAILQSLANSGIRQFAAGGKARAFGDSAGQEIGEAEREKVCGDWSCAIRSGQAGAPDLGKIFQANTETRGLHPGTTPLTWVGFSNHLGKIFQAETETRGLHPGITPLIWVRFSNHLGKISRRGETSRKVRSILPYGRISGWNAPKCKVSKVGISEDDVSLSPLCPFPALARTKKRAPWKKVRSARFLPTGEPPQPLARPGDRDRVESGPPVPDLFWPG